METKLCPECGATLLKKTKKCPYCGHKRSRLNYTTSPDGVFKPEPEKAEVLTYDEDKVRNWAFWSCGFGVLISILGLILGIGAYSLDHQRKYHTQAVLGITISVVMLIVKIAVVIMVAAGNL